jgi:hypothetical protein
MITSAMLVVTMVDYYAIACLVPHRSPKLELTNLKTEAC